MKTPYHKFVRTPRISVLAARFGYSLFFCLLLSGCKSFMDAFLAPAPNAQTYSQTSASSCPDVEYLGLFSIDSGPGVKTYVAKVRNKAPYTKNVTIEFIDMYGQTQRGSFDVKSGDIVEGRLTTTRTQDRKPINVRIASCY